MVYYESNEHVFTISDSSKQADARNKPIKDIHIFDIIYNLSVGVGSIEPAVIRIGIIGQGSTQLITNIDTRIISNLVTDILTDSSKQLFNTNTFQINTLQSEAFVIGPQDKSVESNRKIICTPSDSRKIRGNISVGFTPQE